MSVTGAGALDAMSGRLGSSSSSSVEVKDTVWIARKRHGSHIFCVLNSIDLSNPILMRYAVKLIVLQRKLFCLSIIKDSCEQSGVNTIKSLQGFPPL